MPQIFAADSRLPQTDGAGPTPVSVSKNLKILELQTAADTRYDVQGAKLREPFVTVPTGHQWFWVYGIFIVLVIIIILTIPLSSTVRVVSGIAIIVATHQILASLEK